MFGVPDTFGTFGINGVFILFKVLTQILFNVFLISSGYYLDTEIGVWQRPVAVITTTNFLRVKLRK